MKKITGKQSRRSFLQNTGRAAMLITTAGYTDLEKLAAADQTHAEALVDQSPADGPWYKTVTRWGQVNITEKDPPQYDIPGGGNIGSVPIQKASLSMPVVLSPIIQQKYPCIQKPRI